MEGESAAGCAEPGGPPEAMPTFGAGASSPAARAIATAAAIAVGRPGRRAARRRRRVAGGGGFVVGIVCVGDQVLWSAAKASAASRHQSSIAAAIQRVSS